MNHKGISFPGKVLQWQCVLNQGHGHMCLFILNQIPLDPQHFGLLDPDPLKYADPQIQWQNINLKLKKNKIFCSQNSIWTAEKRELSVSLSWMFKVCHKDKWKKKEKWFENSSSVKKSVNILKKCSWPGSGSSFSLVGIRIQFFLSGDPDPVFPWWGSGSASKLNESLALFLTVTY